MVEVLGNALKNMRRRRWGYLFAIFAMATLISLLDILTSHLVEAIYQVLEDATYEKIPGMIVKNFFFGIILIVLWRFFTILYNDEAKRATANLQRMVYKKALRLPMERYESDLQGSFLTKLGYHIEQAADVYGSRFRRVLTPFISVSVYLVAMFAMNWKMAFLLVSLDVILFFLNLYLDRPIRAVSEEMMVQKEEKTAVFLDIFRGSRMIRLYGIQRKMKEKYEGVLQKLFQIQVRRTIYFSILECFQTGFDLLGAVLFLAVGVWMASWKMVQLKELVAIYVIYAPFSYHFLQMGKYVPELVERLSYMKELFTFLESEEETDTTIIREKENEFAILFDRVSFSYPDGTQLFENLSVGFEKNRVTALTGRTGCGKSTLMKLLLGFYPIDGGNIFLYGREIRTWGYRAVREQIAYVPQEPYLYHVSIAENISYGAPGKKKEEIMQAAKCAGADAFIRRQPNGYDTIVENGGRSLSGGERQRIAIARAILKDAKIIVMDEATSALDLESERVINEFINAYRTQKTIILIAHRQETIQKADVEIKI